MTRRVVTFQGRRYTDSPDAGALDANRTWALVEARLVDELTNDPVETPVRLEPAGSAFARPGARHAVQPRIAAGGIVGLVGTPRRVLPRQATAIYEMGMTIDAAGYVPATAVATLAALPGFPGAFDPLQLGDVLLHRQGVEVHGRVMHRKANGDLEPVKDATVAVTNVWRALPTLTVAVAAQAPNILALALPSYAGRIAGTGSVRSCVLAPDTTQTKILLRPTAVGDRVVLLSDRQGLNVNRIVGVDDAAAGRIEYMVIASIDTTVPINGPGRVTLVHPLALAHAEGVEAMPVAVQGPLGPSVSLALDSIPGDRTLVLNSMAGLGAPTAVRISGGAIREYHLAQPPSSDLTDADGFYRLPLIAREAQVRLSAQKGAMGPVDALVFLDYSAREQRVDFVFP